MLKTDLKYFLQNIQNWSRNRPNTHFSRHCGVMITTAILVKVFINQMSKFSSISPSRKNHKSIKYTRKEWWYYKIFSPCCFHICYFCPWKWCNCVLKMYDVASDSVIIGCDQSLNGLAAQCTLTRKSTLVWWLSRNTTENLLTWSISSHQHRFLIYSLICDFFSTAIWVKICALIYNFSSISPSLSSVVELLLYLISLALLLASHVEYNNLD